MSRLHGRVERLERHPPVPVGAGTLSMATVRRIIAGDSLIGLPPQEQATAEALLADLHRCDDLINSLEQQLPSGKATTEAEVRELATHVADALGVNVGELLAEAERIAVDPAWQGIVRQRA